MGETNHCPQGLEKLQDQNLDIQRGRISEFRLIPSASNFSFLISRIGSPRHPSLHSHVTCLQSLLPLLRQTFP